MFESLTQPNYPRAALGLEQTSVTAIALQKERGGVFGIKQAATSELPAHLLTPSLPSKIFQVPTKCWLCLMKS